MDKYTIKFLEESNAIEGVYDKEPLRKAQKAWEYVFNLDKLNITDILETHRILMQGHLTGLELGGFRTVDVWVGGRKGAEPWLVPQLVKAWLKQLKSQKSEKEIKKSHITYEKIHPFIDGNGRTGRIFMNWQRVKNGLPILILRENEKYEYYKWFK